MQTTSLQTSAGNPYQIFTPDRTRQGIIMIDNIVYTTVEAPLKGEKVKKALSLVAKFGNSEMRNATGKADPNQDISLKPLIIYLNGGGFRGVDKNQMVPEMTFLADAGYAVAFVDYRHSGEATFPAQIIDVKSAIRFLRKNAAKFGIDSTKIAVTGGSAGGTLSALAAMNVPGFDEGANLDVSSDVQFALDMFGPAEMHSMAAFDASHFSETSRWKSYADTHIGAWLGETFEQNPEKFRLASPTLNVNEKSAPMLILHGDADNLVPYQQSVGLYDAMCQAGKEADLYIIPGAGHGSDEFWQPSTRELTLKYYDKYLRNI